MASKYKDVYIGKIIRQKVDERGMSYAEFARQIHCARTSLYHIFDSKNIDIERLLLISEVLKFDFINEIYRYKGETGLPTTPYLILPIKEKVVDISQLPDEVLEQIRQQLL